MWGVNTRPKRQFFMTFFAFFELTFPEPLGLQDEKKGPPEGDPMKLVSEYIKRAIETDAAKGSNAKALVSDYPRISHLCSYVQQMVRLGLNILLGCLQTAVT